MQVSPEYSQKQIEFANNFSTLEYVAPEPYFQRRLRILETWAPKPQPGERFLEIGCGDGYLAGLLLDRGYEVTACDKSRLMLDASVQRLEKYVDRGTLRLVELDINELPFPMDEQFEHVIAVMRSFFTYVDDAEATLRELFRITGRRFIADFDPRKTNQSFVFDSLRKAGFRKFGVRAFFVPQKVLLPKAVQRCLNACERIPALYRVASQRKFHRWVLAEK